jgi:hypothetical protein
MMTSELGNPTYTSIPQFLRERVIGFADSIEYEKLGEECQALAGLVCAALASFICRFQTAELADGLNPRDEASLEQAYDAVECLAGSESLEVKNVVVNEIFENFRGSSIVSSTIKSRLGVQARLLYDRWIKD